MSKKVVLAAAAIAALSSTTANAGSATVALPVTATITASCTFAASTTLDFGSNILNTNVGGGINSIGGALNVTCANTLPYSIGLNDGNNAGPNPTDRFLKDAVNGGSIQYQVYTDSARTTVAVANSLSNAFDTAGYGTGTGAQQTIAVYGKIPQQTTPVAGTYTDSLTATVNF